MKKYIAILLGLAFLTVAVFAVAQEKKAEDTYTLKAPLGAVKFDHKKHAAAAKCDTCHHASKAAMPNKAAHQACTDCHTNPAKAGVPKAQLAFHNATAKAGTCIDCHVKEAAAGKKAPTKCAECHQKGA